ncbi:MAG: winged helix-turn-helix transcriptional regulator [Acidobacteria bacterium]|nr:winged helix-turn-helix transcriptional regulator [Acidobacteriota bacterium]
MARAATTSDIFNAIAEPRRRQILTLLAPQERTVGDIAIALAIEQPSVSKHLRVLHSTGLVRMRCQGREKYYRTDADALHPLHEWAATFERYWSNHLHRIKQRAEAAAHTAKRPSNK